MNLNFGFPFEFIFVYCYILLKRLSACIANGSFLNYVSIKCPRFLWLSIKSLEQSILRYSYVIHRLYLVCRKMFTPGNIRGKFLTIVTKLDMSESIGNTRVSILDYNNLLCSAKIKRHLVSGCSLKILGQGYM